MIQIRKKVFETNSSMTHSLVICKKNDYDDWINKKCMFRMEDESFLPIDEARKENAKKLREKLKLINEWNNRQPVGAYQQQTNLSEEVIQKYEEGKYSDKNEALFSKYDMEYYYVSYAEWFDYTIIYMNMEEITENRKIDDFEVVAFGYYGHD